MEEQMKELEYQLSALTMVKDDHGDKIISGESLQMQR